MSKVLVVLEHSSDTCNRMSFEAIAAGQQLAATLGCTCSVAILGNTLEHLCAELSTKQLDKIYALKHMLLADYTSDGYVLALEHFIRQLSPELVIFPHTYQVRDFAPALATRFRRVLISDVIAMHAEPGSKPIFVRQLFQGKLNAEYTHSTESPNFISVQAGTFRSDSVLEGSAAIETVVPSLTPSQIRSKPSERFRESASTVDLSNAPVIVSIGRGIGEADNIPLIEDFATALGAELAASRPICDSGWLPMERQVGSSGQTVAPKVYIAIGISGAIQHLVGMKRSKTIIAINKDENAPIFEVADFGVIGDLFEIVPALTKAILSAKA